jgi:hypothetical protein
VVNKRRRSEFVDTSQDNIATHPSLGLPTTCGSLALLSSKPKKNAEIIDQVSIDQICSKLNGLLTEA